MPRIEMPDTSTTRMLKPQVTKCTKARVQTWYTLSRVYQDFKGRGQSLAKMSATGASITFFPLANFGQSAELQSSLYEWLNFYLALSSYKTGVLVITAQLSTENTVQVPFSIV